MAKGATGPVIYIDIGLEEHRTLLTNLYQLFLYELSCFVDSIVLRPDGTFGSRNSADRDWDHYLHPDEGYKDNQGYAFIVMVDNEPAGFMLVSPRETADVLRWHVTDFFFLRRFQRQKIAMPALILITRLLGFNRRWSFRFDVRNRPMVVLLQQFMDAADCLSITQLSEHIREVQLLIHPRGCKCRTMDVDELARLLLRRQGQSILDRPPYLSNG